MGESEEEKVAITSLDLKLLAHVAMNMYQEAKAAATT